MSDKLNRRQFMTAAGSALAATQSRVRRAHAQAKQPNILYIMTDQQRYDSLGYTGLTPCRTPHLDALARNGTRFDNAYSVCALCSPARTSMLCGLYPHKHGMIRNCSGNPFHDLRDGFRLISNELDDAGYNCGYSGKWHCGIKKVPSSYAFTGMDVPNYGNPYIISEYEAYLQRRGLEKPERVQYTEIGKEGGAGTLSGPPEAAASYFIADYALELMQQYVTERRQSGKPFLMFVSFWGPHLPCVIPEPYASMYDPADVTLWPNFRDDLKGKPYVHTQHRLGFGHPLNETEWREYIAKYWGFCTFIDDQIGRMLKALDDWSIAGETAVMFSSDHGDMSGAHGGFWDKGPLMYEETYHIPLLVHCPWLENTGGQCERLVSNIDLATTVLDIAGVPPSTQQDGRSLVPLCEDPNGDWSDQWVSEFNGHRYLYAQRMLRWDRYKFVFNVGGLNELYDLANDPYEMENRISDPALASVKQECKERMIQWILDSRDTLRRAIPILKNT